jgi:hypothetical protein
MVNSLTRAQAIEVGPTYLEKYASAFTEQGDDSFAAVFEAPNKARKFRVLFSGTWNDREGFEHYILDDPTPTRIELEDPVTGDRFLLIDFGLYGYDNLVVYGPKGCTKPLKNTYIWKDESVFEVRFRVTYNIDFDDPDEEFFPNSDGNLELEGDGPTRFVSMDKIRRDAFDWFEVSIVSSDGGILEIVSAEMA